MAADGLSKEKVVAALRKMDCAAEVEYYDRLPSTSDRARARIILGDWDGATPICVVTDFQSAGRGRRANAWRAPTGSSLLFSIAEPMAVWGDMQSLAALITALAVTEALDDVCGLRATLKWPNDIRVDARKLSGVLVEASSGSSGGALIVGIGVNMNQTEDDLEDELRATTTSVLNETGGGADRVKLLSRIVARIRARRAEAARGDGDRVIDAIRARLDTLGRFVTVTQEHGRREEGVAIGLERDGGLVIRQANGQTVTCLTGSLREG